MNDAACINRRITTLERTIAHLERRVKELEERLQPGAIALTSGISAVGVPDPEFDWTKIEAIQYEDWLDYPASYTGDEPDQPTVVEGPK